MADSYHQRQADFGGRYAAQLSIVAKQDWTQPDFDGLRAAGEALLQIGREVRTTSAPSEFAASHQAFLEAVAEYDVGAQQILDAIDRVDEADVDGYARLLKLSGEHVRAGSKFLDRSTELLT